MSKEFVDIEQLKRKRNERLEEAKSVLERAQTEVRPMTEEERKTYDQRKQEVEGLDQTIEEQQKLQELEMRGGGNSVDEQIENSGFRSLGEWAQVALTNPGDPRLREVRTEAGEIEMGTPGEGTSAGLLIPPQYSTDLMQVSPQEAIVRPRATVFPPDGQHPDSSMQMPVLDQTDDENMYGGVEVDWISEGEEKHKTDTSFYSVTLTPKEVAAFIEVTDQALRNSAQLETLIRDTLRRAIIAGEDKEFLRGTGSGKPQGILESDARKSVARVEDDNVTYEDLVNMFAKVHFGGDLVWVISQSLLPKLMRLKDEADQLIWMPNAREGSPGNLLGLPVYLNQRSPGLGDEGDIMLCDFSYYLIKDGFGLAIAASEHVQFKKNRTIIKAFKLVDGKPWLKKPLYGEDGEEYSPFVTLDEYST